MISDISKHSNHYSVLAMIVSLGLLLFILTGSSAILQMLVVVLVSSTYVIWGVVHHHLLQDLTAEIVLEYLIIAVLVVAVFWALLM